ncbi:MAG TPA: 50S ribosomal protein L11 methyltransferase [Gaiellaceae bacterium]|nr:50S ribosomal protein L11 methyltransferase [Gaiellaceae bacterium]
MIDVVRVAVRLPAARREEAIARLLALVPSGFDERAAGELIELGAYVHPDEADAIRAVFRDAVVEPVPPGWEDRWRAFHHAVIAGGLWVGPPWEFPPGDLPAVVVEPGRAFGTGAHPTTRLCLELLARLPAKGSLLDVGCGSGVLAIAAVRLGFDPVVAVDVDPVAVDVARSNASANGVAVEVLEADATVGDRHRADAVVANIARVTVERVLERVAASHAITAGYLASERPAAPGWQPVERIELDGWAADHLRRETV